MDKDVHAKIASCKALQGKTVEDLIATDRFRDNLAAYMTEQRELRNTARQSYEALRKFDKAKGYKLPAHPVDRVSGLTVGEFAAEFMAVIAKKSDRPAAERQYIQQLGMQAYNLTVAQFVVEEYPDLEPILLPKPTNAN